MDELYLLYTAYGLQQLCKTVVLEEKMLRI